MTLSVKLALVSVALPLATIWTPPAPAGMAELARWTKVAGAAGLKAD